MAGNFYSWLKARCRFPKNETIEQHMKHCRAKIRCPFDIFRSRDYRARKKLKKWLDGVTESSVKEAIAVYIENGLKNGDIKRTEEGDEMRLSIAANAFFEEYSRKVIVLSDGRCVYFAPDEKNRKRGWDNDKCWAVYCIHAVTHGGKPVKGKTYAERVWSAKKVESLLRIEDIIRREKCTVELVHDHPERDSIVFNGVDSSGERMAVVTRLDEYGNINADLTEVTAVMVGGKAPPTECYGPLTEAVRDTVIHQADGYSSRT